MPRAARRSGLNPFKGRRPYYAALSGLVLLAVSAAATRLEPVRRAVGLQPLTVTPAQNQNLSLSKEYVYAGGGLGQGVYTNGEEYEIFRQAAARRVYDEGGRLVGVTSFGARAYMFYDGSRTMVTDQAGKQRVSRTDALGGSRTCGRSRRPTQRRRPCRSRCRMT